VNSTAPQKGENMNRLRTSKGLFGILLGLLLIALLLFANQNMTRQSPQKTGDVVSPSATIPLVTASLHDLRITATYIASLPKFPTIANPPATPIPPTAIISPTATSTLTPPQCTFPLAQITTEESMPERYTFSEPQVLLTAPVKIYNIIEWLPNNQQVLITVDQYSTREKENDKFLRQSIELYDPETNASQVYAIRHYVEEPPSWQPVSNAVVYPEMNFMGIDENTRNRKFTRQVWVSYGNPNSSQMLADNLPQFPVVVKPDGSETVYLSDKRISKRDGSLSALSSVPFDLIQWNYRQAGSDEFPVPYKMAWQPGTSLIFLYSNGGMEKGGGYTFILDSNTGRICELNLGGWAVKARWSSDGHYLAIIRAEISAFPVNLIDIVVLDTATGNLYTAGVTPQEMEGKHFVDDFIWAPDNRHLLAVASIIPFQGNRQEGISGIYLVDFVSAKSDRLLPAYTFYASMGDNNLAWSPDGSKLLIRCPTMKEERVCFVSVQRMGQ
jgi:Tol biopolymer transport system component